MLDLSPDCKIKTRSPLVPFCLHPASDLFFILPVDLGFCKFLGNIIIALRILRVLPRYGVRRALCSRFLFLLWGRCVFGGRDDVCYHKGSSWDLPYLSKPRNVAQSQDRNAHFWAEGFQASWSEEQVLEAGPGAGWPDLPGVSQRLVSVGCVLSFPVTCEPLGAGRSDFLYPQGWCPRSVDNLSPLSFSQRREATPQLHILLPENQKKRKEESRRGGF